MNEFEEKLQRQPMRQIPDAWREEILSAAGNAQAAQPASTGSRRSFLSMVRSQLASLLWPSQLAWGGLAAIWILILALQFSIRDKSPVRAEKVSPPSQETMVQLRKQQQLFTELIGPREKPVADRSKTYPSSSRSQCLEIRLA